MDSVPEWLDRLIKREIQEHRFIAAQALPIPLLGVSFATLRPWLSAGSLKAS